MLSVVIPTRNRRARLCRTLKRVLAQEAPPGGFEVVVADNGSDDDTLEAVAGMARAAAGRLRSVSAPRPGPAAARNAGVRASAGEVILFLGDDTEPATDDLLAEHAKLHRQWPASMYAVLGKVVWDEREPVTPLMRWLDTGPQFAYELLEPGAVDVAAYFYTAHVSLKRAALEQAGGFDERFPYAAVEDIELGLRLSALGVKLEYRPELVVLHSHPTSLERWLERMRLVGRSAALLERMRPGERASTVPIPKGPLYACVRAAAPVVAPFDHPAAPAAVRQLRWRILHHAAYARGYREGPPPAETSIARASDDPSPDSDRG